MSVRLRQQGLSLVEMTLSVGVLLFVGGYLVTQVVSISNDRKAKAYVDQMAAVREAGSNYFLTNRTAILDAASTGTGASTVCVVNANAATGTGGETANNTTKNTCAVDVAWLQYKGFLSTSVPATAPDGSRWVVVYKRLKDTAAVLTDNAEMLVVPAKTVGSVSVAPVADQAKKGDALERAAATKGGEAGIVPADVSHPCGWGATTANQYICGVGGAWKAKVADFVN